MVESEKPKIPRKAKTAAKLLVAHGATEVYLFGSWATGTAKRGSDIDLAIRGIAPRDYFAALGDVLLAIGSAVDVVDLDKDSPFVRHLIEHAAMVRVA